MSSVETKIKNFQNAISRLEEGVLKFDEANDLSRDGLIQRFEFTFELAWKTLKECFENEGLTGLNSPKTILREAFAGNLIGNEELWLEMLNDRNSTTHIYDEKIAIEICNNIKNKYIDEFGRLLKNIKARN